MAETLQFELVSPERMLASTEAEMVTVPGMEGDLTAMPNHAPFMTTLRPGHVVVHGREQQRYFVSGGFAEIYDNTVTVLAEIGLEHHELTREWLEERVAEARTAVEEAGPERIQPATQKLNDYLGVLAHVDLPPHSESSAPLKTSAPGPA
jgi:F-type H+-transporting ATPase subunit epsilon